jgi:hypothetical protein
MRLSLVMLVAIGSPAAADATIDVMSASWQDAGWPAGRPVLTVSGIDVQGGTKAHVPAFNQMTRATVKVGSSTMSFWFELRDQHRIHIQPDPCCFLQVFDLDSRLEPKLACADDHDRCPAGLVAANKFVWKESKCGARATCAPTARLRVRGGAVTIELEGTKPEPWTDRVIDVGRQYPQPVTVRQGDKVIFSDRVVFQHGRSYVLDIGSTGTVKLLVDDH